MFSLPEFAIVLALITFDKSLVSYKCLIIIKEKRYELLLPKYYYQFLGFGEKRL